MGPSHLTQLVKLEDNYWWHVAKRRLVLRLLRQFAPAPGRLVEDSWPVDAHSLMAVVLRTAAAAERFCMAVSRIPVGLSLVGVLRK